MSNERQTVDEFGVSTGDGVVVTWSQLYAIMQNLTDATDAEGKVAGKNVDLSQYTKEHWQETRAMIHRIGMNLDSHFRRTH